MLLGPTSPKDSKKEAMSVRDSWPNLVMYTALPSCLSRRSTLATARRCFLPVKCWAISVWPGRFTLHTEQYISQVALSNRLLFLRLILLSLQHSTVKHWIWNPEKQMNYVGSKIFNLELMCRGSHLSIGRQGSATHTDILYNLLNLRRRVYDLH